MLHDLALYALGVVTLCTVKVLIHRLLHWLAGRLCPGDGGRAWRLEIGTWVLTVELNRKPKKE